jgi:hypothetical protein
MTDSNRTERRLIDSIRKAKQDGDTAAEPAADGPPTRTPAAAAPAAAAKRAPARRAPARRAPVRRAAAPASEAGSQDSTAPRYQSGRRVWPD